jgi:hypothetical protein
MAKDLTLASHGILDPRRPGRGTNLLLENADGIPLRSMIRLLGFETRCSLRVLFAWYSSLGVLALIAGVQALVELVDVL